MRTVVAVQSLRSGWGIAVGVALAVGAGVASGAEPLVWKWAAGDSARYHMTQQMRMTMGAGPAGQITSTSRQDTVLRWTVDGVDDSGTAKLRQSTERVVMRNDGPMGQGFTFDSADEEPPVGAAALVAPMFRAMCENPFLLTMKPSGEIADVELSKELAAAFDDLPGGAVSGKMIEQMTQQGSLRFPDRPLAVGDDWTTEVQIDTPQMGTMRVATTYTYEGPREVEGRTLEAFTPAVSIEPAAAADAPPRVTIETKQSDGEVLFDRAAGRVESSLITQVMTVRVRVGEQEVVNEITQAMTMRRLAEGDRPDFGTAPADPEEPPIAPPAAEKP